MLTRGRVVALLTAALLGTGASAGPATAVGPVTDAAFAPVDTPGAPLTVDPAAVERALACSPGVTGATRTPVLLLQGTGATAKDNWSWTYQPAFDALGVPWCALDLPEHATADIQQAGEYVVHALRTMAARAGRRVSIVGHSQGGMVGRWALRWWPDTRALVDDLVGFAPSNHGTTRAVCSAEDPCSPAGWQQRDESDFMRALNSRQETFAGISYTSIYTRVDETVQPNQDAETGSSSLRTGDGARTNVATQDICPAAAYEHLLIGLVDPVAYALAIDALTHDGPADPARIDRGVCLQVLHPGIDPVTAPADGAAAAISFQSYRARTVPAEPALACYTTASCPRSAPAAACTPARRTTVTLARLARVRVTVNGRRTAVTRTRTGRVRVRLDLRRRAGTTVVVRARGTDARGRRVSVVRRVVVCG
ncbi:esterase/lipase family protein [Paraconexibacter algicola]|uniref:Lipase n=1 Tax=Paraconexibacter algicola TaxID=2133960 RepID=A0A2T4UN64_9ACTN|nr:lipase [Paraconexibacter algicola]PTL60676.1 lipase [Paraconexibacter algicola]